MRYAAAIAVAASIGATWVSRTNDKFAQACNVISVPAGQHVDVTLPDGTQVCMNALSPNCAILHSLRTTNDVSS